MREPSTAPAVAVSAALLLTAGCASSPRGRGDLAPILPTAESRLETASPAARDALDEGLRWIAEDAPATRVENRPPTESAKGDGP